MDTEKIINTQKTLAEIYKKAKKVAIHKSPWSEDDFRNIEIFDDGTIGATYSVGCRGCYEHEYIEIELEDLDKSPEQLHTEWHAILAKKQKEYDDAKEAENLRQKDEEEKENWKTYLQLKQKYEKQ